MTEITMKPKKMTKLPLGQQKKKKKNDHMTLKLRN